MGHGSRDLRPPTEPASHSHPSNASEPSVSRGMVVRSVTEQERKASRRSVSEQQIKILWGVGAICAFPWCTQPLVEEATAADPAAVIGEMAHILGVKGPRHDPALPEAQLNLATNLILLCPTHHTLVDAQDSSYTAEELRTWKREQEQHVRARLGEQVKAVDFQELERATRNLLAVPAKSIDDLAAPLRPREKLARNELTAGVGDMLNIGYLRFDDVKEFVARTETIEPGYGERLAEGFRDQYRQVRDGGLTGDAVFYALAEWSARGSDNISDKAAGVAVLVYLFTICDVFET
jgi:hypothetical protein